MHPASIAYGCRSVGRRDTPASAPSTSTRAAAPIPRGDGGTWRFDAQAKPDPPKPTASGSGANWTRKTTALATLQRNKGKILDTIREIGPETVKQIRVKSVRNKDYFDEAWGELERSGVVVPVEIKKRGRKETGWCIRGELSASEAVQRTAF